MDLVNVQELISPTSEAEIPPWRPGDAYVAGGTWLFSEPQPEVRRLIDLSGLPTAPISVGTGELRLAAGCTYRELREQGDRLGDASELFERAVRTLSSSFKTWGLATIGGNVCLAYPKSMMAPVFSLLKAEYELRTPGGVERTVPAELFQIGAQKTVRRDGEYLRAVRIPAAALYGRFALAKESYTATSHAVAMVIGRDSVPGAEGTIRLVASAATAHPVAMEIAADATEEEAVRAMEGALRSVQFLDDGHGSASYRNGLLRQLVANVWGELHEEGLRES